MCNGVAVIVDDNLSISKLVKRFMERMGFKVVVFSCPMDVVDFISTKNGGKTRVLITDVDMPGMLGTELTRRVKFDFPDIIVVCMSGNNENEESCWENGCDFFVSKPFKFADFKNLEI